MRPVYFISDLHLASPHDEREKARHDRVRGFIQFLCREAETVYIVGDYFDFWFEYRRAIPTSSLWGLHYLMLLRDANVNVHFLIGNHDCWGEHFLDRELGIRTYRHPLECVIAGRKILLIHGDGVSSMDRRYNMIKPLLRSRLSRKLYRILHPDVGIWLADTMSTWSKARDRDYAKYASDPSIGEFVRDQLARGFDAVMMGHHHLPRYEEYEHGVFIGLGDWVSHSSYAVLNEDGLYLKTWGDP